MTDLVLEEAGSGEEGKQVCVLFLNYIFSNIQGNG